MYCFYRFSKSEFSDRLVSMGSLRLGTLHDFRRCEHGGGIFDEGEGRKSLTSKVDRKKMSSGRRSIIKGPDGEKMEAFLHPEPGGTSWGLVRDVNSDVFIDNASFTRNIDMPDYFVYCMSAEKSTLIMRQFEGADSCVQITNVDQFLGELTNAINAIIPVSYLGWQAVRYQAREETWDGNTLGVNPVFMKPSRYSLQKEIRAIWAPKFGQNLTPMVLGNYNLGRFCQKLW